MAEGAHEFISTGALANRLGYSVSNVKKLERMGVIPGARLEGSNRRIFRRADLPEIEAIIAARRAAVRPTTKAASAA